MRQVGKGIGRRQPIHATAEENPPAQLVTSSVVLEDSKASDWLRLVGILQKHWKISDLFDCVMMITVTAVTFLTKTVYQATARIVDDPSCEQFSLEYTDS